VVNRGGKTSGAAFERSAIGLAGENTILANRSRLASPFRPFGFCAARVNQTNSNL
jgi:hypothetical protein